MRQSLIRHPDFPCEAVAAIEAEAERPAGRRLVLRYWLEGVTDALVIPPGIRERADGLWRHTCFEAFVRASGAEGYRELNVATGSWAAYRFDGYRAGMADADIGPPDIHLSGPGGRFTLTAAWELDLPADAAWRVGVSCVIEERGGRLSYWALKHPAGRPDFHDPDCFVAELPAPDRP